MSSAEGLLRGRGAGKGGYLNRSSNARLAELVGAECVALSTVFRGSQSVQLFFASFAAIRSGTGCMHWNRAPGSK